MSTPVQKAATPLVLRVIPLQLYAGRRPELPFLSELAAELPELEPEDAAG